MNSVLKECYSIVGQHLAKNQNCPEDEQRNWIRKRKKLKLKCWNSRIVPWFRSAFFLPQKRLKVTTAFFLCSQQIFLMSNYTAKKMSTWTYFFYQTISLSCRYCCCLNLSFLLICFLCFVFVVPSGDCISRRLLRFLLFFGNF